jgi:hypothetical protein
MSRDKNRALMWALPVTECLAMLTCSIVESNPGAVAPMHGVIRVVTEMARHLPVEKKFQVAEALRDAADVIERSREVAHIEIK